MATLTKVRKPAGRPEMILEAATSIIGERGYYGFSIKDVAEMCGLTVPGVLYHFGTKESILHAVIAERDERDGDAIWSDILASGLEGFAALSLDSIKHRLHETMLRNSKQPDSLRLFSMLRTEALYPQHPLFAYFQNRTSMAIKALCFAFAGKLPNPETASRQVLAIMSGLENLWLEQNMEFDLVEEWDRLIDRILG